MRFFVSMLLCGSLFCLTACSDDDETPTPPDEITTETMFGNYSGKMSSWNIVPNEGEDNGEDAPAGIDISATVKNDTIHLEKFPIKDIVLSIVKDETLADKIVEAVGDVNYKVGYEPTLTTAKDSIELKLNPEPLKLSVTIPTATEGEEAQPLLIEVKVEPGEEPDMLLKVQICNFTLPLQRYCLVKEKISRNFRGLPLRPSILI